MIAETDYTTAERPVILPYLLSVECIEHGNPTEFILMSVDDESAQRQGAKVAEVGHAVLKGVRFIETTRELAELVSRPDVDLIYGTDVEDGQETERDPDVRDYAVDVHHEDSNEHAEILVMSGKNDPDEIPAVLADYLKANGLYIKTITDVTGNDTVESVLNSGGTVVSPELPGVVRAPRQETPIPVLLSLVSDFLDGVSFGD